ncbi:MAG: SDR family NAD(P)-dependent oxidoreductase [Pseudomonadota bacterium]
MHEAPSSCAVVTGAASGIGRAIACALAQRQIDLVLVDIDADALHATARHIGEVAPAVRTLAIVADLSQPEAMPGIAERAFAQFGSVDWLYNCAGMLVSGRSWELDERQWNTLMNVNLWSVVRAARAFVPRMLEQGRGHIVNIASLAGLLVGPWIAPYTVSKHGLVAYSETLHQELRALDLPVNVSIVLPGPVDTGICRHIDGAAGDAQVDAGNTYLRTMIAGGMTPDALAAIVLAGVDANKLWIFPHAEILKGALKQRSDMLLAVQ